MAILIVMKFIYFPLALMLLATTSQVRSETAESATESNANPTAEEVAIIETTKGNMTIAFWNDVAPETVANFKKLARKNFYDGTAFHRIIDGFMVQGGDPLTKDPANKARYGTGDPGYKIKAEFNKMKHERGVISMARSRDPDSAGSQFFIMLAANPGLDGQYTAFGKLIAGDDTLTKIGKTSVGPSRGGEMSSPLERVEVKSIRIQPREKAPE